MQTFKYNNIVNICFFLTNSTYIIIFIIIKIISKFFFNYIHLYIIYIYYIIFKYLKIILYILFFINLFYIFKDIFKVYEYIDSSAKHLNKDIIYLSSSYNIIWWLLISSSSGFIKFKWSILIKTKNSPFEENENVW